MKRFQYNPLNKYVRCYCDKRQTILVGWGISIYGNIFVSVCMPLLVAAVLFAAPLDWHALMAMGFMLSWVFLLWWTYSDNCKQMQEAGHSAYCSKKIAMMSTWYFGQWSEFRINVDPSEVDPQGDYGTPAHILFFFAFTTSLMYLFFATQEEIVLRSLFFPILFTVVIIGSLILLIRIKNMRRAITVMLLFNIFDSAFMLLLFAALQ